MKKVPFDLNKALNGARVIDSGGNKIIDLKVYYKITTEHKLVGIICFRHNSDIGQWRIDGTSAWNGNLFLLEEPEYIPMTMDDLPPIFWINNCTHWSTDGRWTLPDQVHWNGIRLNGVDINWKHLKDNLYFYSVDRKVQKRFQKEK